MSLKPGWELLFEAGQRMIDVFATFEKSYEGEPITRDEYVEARYGWLSNLYARCYENIPKERIDQVVQMVMEVETTCHAVWHPFAIDFLRCHSVPHHIIERHADENGYIVINLEDASEGNVDLSVMTPENKEQMDEEVSLANEITIFVFSALLNHHPICSFNDDSNN